MLNIQESNRFKKHMKRAQKRGNHLSKLFDALYLLQSNQPLPPKLKNHKLKGNFDGAWECHIEPDWLLIYKIEDDNLWLLGLGTHADLFE